MVNVLRPFDSLFRRTLLVCLAVLVAVMLTGCDDDSNDYALVLHRIEEVGLRYSPRPPDGFKWLVVEATIANLEGDPVEVMLDDLRLIDTDENRYSAEPPDVVTVPPLITTYLERDTQQRGLVRFAVPPDVQGIGLEWCIRDDLCERHDLDDS